MRLTSLPIRERASPPRALPRRLRRPRLLIVGCGDVGLRLARELGERFGERVRVFATSRRVEQRDAIRAAGATPLAADLDERRTLRRIAGLARWLVDLAPPPSEGPGDPRSRRLIAALRPRLVAAARAGQPARWSYVSTTGVYGDCGGATFDETRPVRPASARGKRRVAAERLMRGLARDGLARVSVLRAPGIYGHDRLPLDRLEKRTPALAADDDVHTNHIHADDLARLCWLALFRGRAGRVYHAVDGTDLKMGDYFDAVADAFGLPRPPRLPRDELAKAVTPMMLSFMSESRRLLNRRIREELRARLRYPTVADTLRDAVARQAQADVRS